MKTKYKKLLKFIKYYLIVVFSLTGGTVIGITVFLSGLSIIEKWLMLLFSSIRISHSRIFSDPLFFFLIFVLVFVSFVFIAYKNKDIIPVLSNLYALSDTLEMYDVLKVGYKLFLVSSLGGMVFWMTIWMLY